MYARLNLVAACFSLTALSYGLGRFAFGLLLPEVLEDLSLDVATAGWIGSGAFASYCLGIVLSMWFGARLPERRMAILASLSVTCGMAVAAAAPSAWLLGAAMILAGFGTGLTSPPLTASVDRHLEVSARPKANGAINAGTAVGIVFSGMAMMVLPLSWRELYSLFAAIGAAVTVWLWFAVPDSSGEPPDPSSNHASNARASWQLCASALLMGGGSTAIWTFGATIMQQDLGFSNERVTLAWVVLGAAGTVGAATGFLVQSQGLRQVHSLALWLMAAAVAALVAGQHWPTIAFPIMASFGAAYIVSTGAFLLWGIKMFAGRPAFGLGVPFLTLAAGQAVGAPIFGILVNTVGTATALLIFAFVIAAATIWSPAEDGLSGQMQR